MADELANEIVRRALALSEEDSGMTSLELLDHVMHPHRGATVDFDEHYFPTSPFLALLSDAFWHELSPAYRDALDSDDEDLLNSGAGEALEDHLAAVPRYFEERFRLNGAEPTPRAGALLQ